MKFSDLFRYLLRYHLTDDFPTVHITYPYLKFNLSQQSGLKMSNLWQLLQYL